MMMMQAMPGAGLFGGKKFVEEGPSNQVHAIDATLFRLHSCDCTRAVR